MDKKTRNNNKYIVYILLTAAIFIPLTVLLINGIQMSDWLWISPVLAFILGLLKLLTHYEK